MKRLKFRDCFRPIMLSLSLLLVSACTPDAPKQASGIIERDRISLTATANEIIEVLPVAEGSDVTKGQALVKLSHYKQQAQLEQATATRNKAQAALDKLLNGERIEDINAARATLNNARVKLNDAEKNYRRIEQLAKQKLVSQSERDNAQAERDAARASYDVADQAWKKASGNARSEDIDAARAELNAAQASVDLQQQTLDELTIVATRDGILDSLPYNLGERVPVNGVVAIIQAAAHPYARVYIPEPYRVKFPVGTEATVHVDGIDKPLTGKVRWISVEPAFTPYSSMSEADRSRFVYLTEIDLPEGSESLSAGIPVRVDLE